MNIFQKAITPDMPRVLEGEQIYVYVPQATSTNAGIASYTNRDFKVDDGVVSLRWPAQSLIQGPIANPSLIKVQEDEFEYTNTEAKLDYEGSKLVSTIVDVQLKRDLRDAYSRPDLVMLDSNYFVKTIVEKDGKQYYKHQTTAVHYNMSQKLSNDEQAQARLNIGAGSLAVVEQSNKNASEALSKAEIAVTKSTEAINTAKNASNDSVEAINTANTALSNSIEAIDTGNAALYNSNEANKIANTALSTAIETIELANNANLGANDARDIANIANTQSTLAKDLAKTAEESAAIALAKAQEALEQVAEGVGTTVRVNGQAVATFNADIKADVTYVNQKIADLIGSAPDALNTLEELASALKNNDDIVTVLEASIATKADKDTLNTYITTTNNTLSNLQESIATKADKTDLINYVDLTTNQNVGGVKTFTSMPNMNKGLQFVVTDNTSAATDPKLTIFNKNVGLFDANPQEQLQLGQINVVSKEGGYLSKLIVLKETNGIIRTQLLMRTNSATDGVTDWNKDIYRTMISANLAKDGNYTITTKTPDASANDTQIATTAWVRTAAVDLITEQIIPGVKKFDNAKFLVSGTDYRVALTSPAVSSTNKLYLVGVGNTGVKYSNIHDNVTMTNGEITANSFKSNKGSDWAQFKAYSASGYYRAFEAGDNELRLDCRDVDSTSNRRYLSVFSHKGQTDTQKSVSLCDVVDGVYTSYPLATQAWVNNEINVIPDTSTATEGYFEFARMTLGGYRGATVLLDVHDVDGNQWAIYKVTTYSNGTNNSQVYISLLETNSTTFNGRLYGVASYVQNSDSDTARPSASCLFQLYMKRNAAWQGCRIKFLTNIGDYRTMSTGRWTTINNTNESNAKTTIPVPARTDIDSKLTTGVVKQSITNSYAGLYHYGQRAFTEINLLV